MKWFKFYGGDYLADPKMLALTSSERSCWLTLLCLLSVSNDNDADNEKVKYITNERLLIMAGLDVTDDSWDKTLGILEKLKKLEMITTDNGMITILNWKKRQQSNLTSYERVKRHREKVKNDNAMITLDKSRGDKIRRIDKIREDSSNEEVRSEKEFEKLRSVALSKLTKI